MLLSHCRLCFVLNDRGITFRFLTGKSNFSPPQNVYATPGPTNPTIQWVPWVKPPWHTADLSPASNTTVKKVWSEACTPVYAIFDVHRDSFPTLL